MLSFFRRLSVVSSLCIGACFIVNVAMAQQVYSNDFEGAVGSEWSSTITSVTPIGNRRFLGEFRNDTTVLTLNALPAHSNVSFSFDWYAIGSWDGNNTTYGPDIFDISVVGGPTLLHSTFSVFSESGYEQTYPDPYPGPLHPARTGASENNTLGYSAPYVAADSVYQFTYTFAHSDASLQVRFAGILNNIGYPDEAWGIDNLRVSVSPTATVPEPGCVALLVGTGISGAGFLLRRRK